MHRTKLIWKIYPSYLLIVFISVAAVTWYATRAQRPFHIAAVEKELKALAHLAASQAALLHEQSGPESLQKLAAMVGEISDARLTVTLKTGNVIADSDEDPRLMDNHANRPEIMEALSHGLGVRSRYSHTVREEMKYVAVPWKSSAGRVLGTVRAAKPLTAIDRNLADLLHRIVIAGLVVVVMATLICLAMARHISEPLQQIKLGAERFAQGDFKNALHIEGSEEVGSLVETLNKMAKQLDDRIRTVLRQRNELETILGSMVEGVIAIDTDEIVLSVNPGAAQMLGIDPRTAVGRTIQETVRNPALQKLAAAALTDEKPVEADITFLNSGGERFFQVHGTALTDAEGKRIGVVVVLHDVTRLRLLENLRKDFAANVSHELKTPITSIKGFVETLLDGAIEDKEHAERFCRIILAQTDRLHAIIEDLLLLSKIEKDEESGEVTLTPGVLRPHLESAMAACKARADEKKMVLVLDCPPDLRLRLHPVLLEQSVVNLLNNAIAYSPPGSRVLVRGRLVDKEVQIDVQDVGCGIPREHTKRVFERFYRVDKARSREHGGTGLGLAIVKHVAAAHHGHVSVESKVGEGSTFTIHLPALSENVVQG